MMEKQPQILLSPQACFKAATSGPSISHMISGLVSIESPCSEYSGKTTRSIVAKLRRALPTMATMRCVCCARSAFVVTTGNCDCTRPMTTPLGDLFNPPSPFMFVLPSSHDREFARCTAHPPSRCNGDEHEDERQHIRRGVEEVIALTDADRLQRRPKCAGGTEQERGADTGERLPTRKNDERDGDQPLPG